MPVKNFKTIRVLHTLNHVREVGNGIVNASVDLACGQAKLGHAVAVVSSGGEYEALLKHHGVEHICIEQSRSARKIAFALSQLQRTIQNFSPNIIHGHMVTGVVLAKILQSRNALPLVATVHNEFQKQSLLMGLADRVIAVSSQSGKSMIQRGIPREKVRIVRNGTLGSFRRTASVKPKLNLQRPAITTVAGLYKRKGIDVLIEAFETVGQRLPQAHLYIIGDGPDRSLFEHQAARSKVTSQIHFEGFQPNPEDYLAETDVFVLASRREPFGLALSEAREAGCAVIGTQVDGILEVLENGRAGLLVPPGNSQVLAHQLNEILSDSNKLMTWKINAQQNVDWLSVARVCQETLAIYQEL